MDASTRSLQDLLSGLTFYRQIRVDGGIRTGVELDRTTILEHFEIEEEFDPTLVWYVDVRCQGPGLPTDIDPARHWFLSSASLIEDGLSRFAQRLRQYGRDGHDELLQWSDFPESHDEIEKRIVLSASLRIDSKELADILDDVRLHWSERIEIMNAGQVEHTPQG